MQERKNLECLVSFAVWLAQPNPLSWKKASTYLCLKRKKDRKFFYYLSPKENDTYGIRILKYAAQKRIQKAPTDLGLERQFRRTKPCYNSLWISVPEARSTAALHLLLFNVERNCEPLWFALLTHTYTKSLWFCLRSSSFRAYFREILGALTEWLCNCVLII